MATFWIVTGNPPSPFVLQTLPQIFIYYPIENNEPSFHNQYIDSFMAWADLRAIDLQPGFIPQPVTPEYLLCNLRRCDSFMRNKKTTLRFL